MKPYYTITLKVSLKFKNIMKENERIIHIRRKKNFNLFVSKKG